MFLLQKNISKARRLEKKIFRTFKNFHFFLNKHNFEKNLCPTVQAGVFIVEGTQSIERCKIEPRTQTLLG